MHKDLVNKINQLMKKDQELSDDSIYRIREKFYDINIELFNNIDAFTVQKQGSLGFTFEFDINKFIKNETKKDYKLFYQEYFKFIDRDF